MGEPRDPTKEHPSQFSYEVLDAMTATLRKFHLPIHDPFAGTGVRLGALCDRLRLRYTGTEQIGAFIADERVKQGDSTDPQTYPDDPPFVICTSPVYCNGMADHFKASEPEGRHTYRQALHRLVGHDVPLPETNMGRYSIRSGTGAATKYAEIAAKAASWWWPNPIVLNVSDFYVGDQVFPLVKFWQDMLRYAGYKFAAPINVRTRRQRQGANGDRRVEFEQVLVGFPRDRIWSDRDEVVETVPETHAKLLRLFGLKEA